MKAKYIMTRDVVVAGPDMPVAAAKRLLRQRGISGLPVVDDDGHVLGVFSLSDARLRGQPTVGTAMTSPAITVSEDASIEEVAALMATNNLKRIPLVRDGRLVGILARGDIVRYVASRHAWPEEVESRESRESEE